MAIKMKNKTKIGEWYKPDRKLPEESNKVLILVDGKIYLGGFFRKTWYLDDLHGRDIALNTIDYWAYPPKLPNRYQELIDLKKPKVEEPWIVLF